MERWREPGYEHQDCITSSMRQRSDKSLPNSSHDLGRTTGLADEVTAVRDLSIAQAGTSRAHEEQDGRPLLMN
jgi:hypothetical protein